VSPELQDTIGIGEIMGYRMKKQWKQPHFIGLISGIREERVLVNCKQEAIYS
jgi:hypothetical protein